MFFLLYTRVIFNLKYILLMGGHTLLVEYLASFEAPLSLNNHELHSTFLCYSSDLLNLLLSLFECFLDFSFNVFRRISFSLVSIVSSILFPQQLFLELSEYTTFHSFQGARNDIRLKYTQRVFYDLLRGRGVFFCGKQIQTLHFNFSPKRLPAN